MGNSLLLTFFALFLVVLNGFFVAAEFGLVKLRQTQVKAIARKLGWRGRILINVHKNLDAYLSACQLGITLASLGLGWVGEPAFARLIDPLLQLIGIQNEQLMHGISFAAAFFIISFLHIVVGELAPKSMAIRRPEQVGSWTAVPLYVFYWVMYPAIWVLNHSANWILHRAGLDAMHDHDTSYSVEELKLILRASRADDNYSSKDWKVLAQALDFRNLEVADVMRPFNEAAVLYASDDIEKSLDRIVEQRYSRYPYIAEDGGVIGFIHLKDVFFALRKGEMITSLHGMVRPVVHAFPDMPAHELLQKFRSGSPHFAVIAYANQTPIGFVTLDNLLGPLVGEIRDEFRQSQNDWIVLDDGSLIGKGSLPILTLERALGIDIEENGMDSVGGLILHQLGDLPEEGQRIEFPLFDAVVKKMGGTKILLVRIYPKELLSE
jgi:CBS domain containing-hemolysin-like protein